MIKEKFIKITNQPKWAVRSFILIGAILGGIFTFISHPIPEANAQEYCPFDEEFFDDEEYSEDFEEELDEEYDEPMPQEIYDNTKGDTYDLTTFEKAIQEVAYAYYMRGPRIQYNSLKANQTLWFQPETATTQDYSYMTCSTFTRNVYYELLGITIPKYTYSLINYTTGHLGSPEVVGYGAKNASGDFIMTIYSGNTGIMYTGAGLSLLKKIIPYLRIGDVLTYDGHAVMIYDVKYDGSGNVDEAILMQSMHGVGGGYVKTKISGQINIGTINFGSPNYYLYHNSKTGLDGLLEGSLNLKNIKNETHWKNIGSGSDKSKKYSILRFVQENESGQAVLKYSGYYDNLFSISSKTEDRLRYSKLFIEKTLREHADDVVEPGSTMTYIIVVKNNSTGNYTDDLTITENLSDYVTYSGYISSKPGIIFNINDSTLTWNIGKLRSGEEVTIEYSVVIDKGNIGNIILSTGSVGYIPSATIKNEIGKVLNEEQEISIKNSFELLKNDDYTGKELIDKIYEESLGVDLNLKELDITNLIRNTNKSSTSTGTLYVNTGNLFSGMILNKYWNTLQQKEYSYSGSLIYVYNLKHWESLYATGRRADTINSENFRTGDILLYINTDDKKYYDSDGTLKTTRISYENGEYAYVYIDGKFVGVNLGNDGIEDIVETGDDRNEFTTEYYDTIGRSWYSDTGSLSGKTDEYKEWLQYQTLFGKDYYVILRPSLMIRNIRYELDGGENNEDNPSAFILGDEIELKDPAKDGYIFEGWYTDPKYTNQVNEVSEFVDDVVLYAKWNNGSNDANGLTTFEKAIQEVSYAYYMRGPRIQYNSLKAINSWFSPEEATTQDSNYLVCSAFTKNVYYELLGIKIPRYTDALLRYTKKYVGNPEVVGYGAKSGSDFIMKMYNSEASNHIKELINPKISDIIPYLKIGDILTYDGHTIMVYDLVYDETGNIVDAILMHSTHGAGGGYVKTKIPGATQIGNNISFGDANHYLYHNSKENTGVYGLLEGSLNIIEITKQSTWKNIGTGKNKEKEYSILRFVQKDGEGNEVINYHGSDYSDYDYVATPISLSDKTEDRMKFSKLFIEKTVSEHDDDMVELGSTMKYTIFVKNNSNEDYTDALIITENISDFVTYDEYRSNKEGIDFNKKGSILTWDIGKLEAGEEVIIEYSVDVNKSNIGDIIVSTGSVGDIPSATIKNEIGKALNERQETNIEKSFESIKSDYAGKELIDKVYKDSLGVDLNLKEFDITNLIINTNLKSTSSDTVYVNQENPFSRMLLNKYWSTLVVNEANYDGTAIYEYDLKYWKSLSNTGRRADTINSENFRTGDILIYINTNDNTYAYSTTSGLTIKPVTYEDGEYAYIYIDGKFVGVNLGNDGLEGTKDDRNEFTRQYYIDHAGLSWYPVGTLSGKTDEFKESLQLQTLFGKDYYVILRPSLMIRNINYELNGGTSNQDNPSVFILGSEFELTGLTKDGYTFTGWYLDPEYTTKVNNISELIDDVVLYAKWESNNTNNNAEQPITYSNSGRSRKRDKCPNGDNSGSYYDGKCEKDTQNTHNAPNTHNAANTVESPYQRGEELKYDVSKYNFNYSNELNQAYQYAYYYGMTTKESIEDANMTGSLTRLAMAKMLSQYAINILGKEPENTTQKKFNDVSEKLNLDSSNSIALAYQLGIMGINMPHNNFRPYDIVTRAEFATALSRLLYKLPDGKDKYYSTHLTRLNLEGIISNTNPSMKEKRGYAMLMLMRSSE